IKKYKQKKMLNTVILISILILGTFTHSNRKCGHDSKEMQDHYQKMQETYEEIEKSTHKQRILQTNSEAESIRITIDYSTIDKVGLGITQQQKNYLINIMEASKLYFQKLLKVYPLKGNNIFPRGWSPECLQVQVPQNDQIVGVPNSDLHLYVIYTKQNSGMLANAGFCAMADVGIPRPTYGRVNFNLSNMFKFGGDPEVFENDLETTVHEILHVLGFSGSAMYYWIDPDTGKPYGPNNKEKLQKIKIYRGKQTALLTSKNVLEVTRKYYNCPTAEGMQIENEGGAGSFGSHWERTVIYNEMMTGASVSTDSVFSIFTIALLKDTGFYPEVNENMADDIFWGKGKGCDFLENACKSTTEYPEYPKKYNENQCSFEYDGIGIGRPDQFADGCAIVSPYSNRLCTNPNSVLDKNQKLQEQDKLSNYSTQSKCFQSTAVKSSSQYIYSDLFRCHQFKCSPDAFQIIVIFPESQLQVICEKEDQGLKKDIDKTGQKVIGQITCPQDYKRFCNYTPICPNFCSEKGVCVKGQCICPAGFGGVDCSIKCSGVVDNATCIGSSCPSGKFLNPDNTCKQDCPLGLFGRAGKCELCDANCSRCTGPSANECTRCQFMTFLQGNQCVDNCNQNQGFSPNYTLGICQTQLSKTCKGNCETCEYDNSPLCNSCKKGFFLNGDNKECQSQCPLGYFENQQTQACEKLQLGCLQQNNSNTCSQCDTAKQFRLGLNGKCTLCKQYCSQCNPNNLSQCFVCEGSKLVSIDGSCVDKCPDSSYYSGIQKKCENCTIGCQQCNESQCNKCLDDHYINYNNKGCTKCSSKFSQCISCDENQCGNTGQACSQGCKLCSFGKCVQCQDSYYLDYVSKQCVSCSSKFSNCLTCMDNICNQCTTGFSYDLKLKQCQKIPDTGGNTGQACSQGCKLCSFGKCVQCQDSYYLDYVSKQCVSCSSKFSNCLTCMDNICNQCTTGFSYDLKLKQCQKIPDTGGNTGQACSQGCKLCSFGKCVQCQDSYYLDYVSKQCVSCSSKFSNCLTCMDNICNQCTTGFSYDLKLKQCQKIPDTGGNTGQACSQGCKLCSFGKCVQCQDSYYLDYVSKQCVSCSSKFSNCLTCMEQYMPLMYNW
ncbi:leishmanolysin family protein, putative, partial [Ichthyophthirius multifiliis]